MEPTAPLSESDPTGNAEETADRLRELTASLGDGYDRVTGELRSSIVSGETVPGGTKSEVYIRVTESVSELAKSLQIDQSLSVSY